MSPESPSLVVLREHLPELFLSELCNWQPLHGAAGRYHADCDGCSPGNPIYRFMQLAEGQGIPGGCTANASMA
jgi:hypothetical protein